MELTRVIVITCILLANQVLSIVPGRILEDDENVGVGIAEEVPISSFTLTFAEPDVKVQRALKLPSRRPMKDDHYDDDENETLYDELDDEYEDDEIDTNESQGTGSIEPIPIESMRVRYEPEIRFQSQNASPRDSADEQLLECTEECSLPPLPPEMVAAAEHCNVELIYHRPHFPLRKENLPKEPHPTNDSPRSPRRLDTSLRTACGSKCVLEAVNKLNDQGVPDVESITDLFAQHMGTSWLPALELVKTECTNQITDSRSGVNEEQKCKISTTFMNCVRNQMTQNCPKDCIKKECRPKETDIVEEENEENNNTNSK